MYTQNVGLPEVCALKARMRGKFRLCGERNVTQLDLAKPNPLRWFIVNETVHKCYMERRMTKDTLTVHNVHCLCFG